MTIDHDVGARARILAALLVALALLLGAAAERADAAKDAGCLGGGFALVLPGGATVSGTQTTTVPAAALGTSFLVRGLYVDFVVDSATLGVRDYTMTGAPNPLDMTGGRRSPMFASKTPDLRGAVLTGDLSVEIVEDGLTIARAGAGVSMKIQAKDCAQGGVFQMEPARSDGTATVITHTLAPGVFYFDNPFFRARSGQVLVGVPVTARVNLANDVSPNFVGRDSTQVATRLSQTGTTSVWSVASGGRMGGVLGEDSVEVAPPATNCVHQCQAQNRVRGRFVVLGFPFPVPAGSRLAPAAPAAPAAAATAAVRSLSVASRVQRAALRRDGLRVTIAVAPGTRVVRLAVFRLRDGRHAGRALVVRRRAARGGLGRVRFRLAGARLLRGLRPGRYEVVARAGASGTALGATARRRFTVLG